MSLPISVWSGYFFDLPIEKAIEYFLQKGYKSTELAREHCQMLLKRGEKKKVARELDAFLKGNDFSINQAHLSMRDLTLGKKEDFLLMEEEIELCKLLGIKNIVFHIGKGLLPMPEMPYSEKLKIRVEVVKKLLPLVDNTPFNLCIENLVANTRTSREIRDILQIVDSENIKVCFDTGHLNQTGLESQLDFMQNLGDKITAIHLNDNDGKNEQHFLPYSLGLDIPKGSVKRIDFDEVCFGLAQIDYKGLLNFEVPGERQAPLDIRLAKLDYIMQIGKYFQKQINNYKNTK